MQRVSSQLTIVIRIVLPTVWFTTILSLIILLLWAVKGKAGLFGNPYLWVGILLIFGSGFVLIRLFLWKYYRVDMDQRFVYVTNYFKTYKYPLTDIESIQRSKMLPDRVFIIRLRSKGTFGQNIRFLASQVLWEDYLKTHPDVADLVVHKA